MKRFGVLVILILAAAAVAVQFIPVNRTNPPVEDEISVSGTVSAILRRSCYDCHSNETRWPWYSYMAPVSWLVAHDVHEARSKMNFSTWNRLDDAERTAKIREIWDEVSEGKMPLPKYLRLHPDARLTEADRRVLQTWAQESSAR